jgi:hypothetical protein
VHDKSKGDQNSGKGTTKDLREANENIRKAQDEEVTDTSVEPKKTGNRPRFDRDR